MNTTVNFINGSESNNWSKIEAGQSFELQKSKKKKTQQNNAFDLSSSFAHGSNDAMMRPKNKVSSNEKICYKTVFVCVFMSIS